MLSSHVQKTITLESAEGCYSYVILHTHDISVKYAVKAFTSMPTRTSQTLTQRGRRQQQHVLNTAFTHGVHIGIGSKDDKSLPETNCAKRSSMAGMCRYTINWMFWMHSLCVVFGKTSNFEGGGGKNEDEQEREKGKIG